MGSKSPRAEPLSARDALSETDAPKVGALAPKAASLTPKGPIRPHQPRRLPLAHERRRRHARGLPRVHRSPGHPHVVLGIVKKRAPPQPEENLAQDVLAEALRAFERSPPGRDDALVDWLRMIAQRVVADSTKKRKRRGNTRATCPRTTTRRSMAATCPSAATRVPSPWRATTRAPTRRSRAGASCGLDKQVEGSPRDSARR